MKKILLASTALIATAGFAAAEVVIEGTAEMGLTNADYAGKGDGVKFHNSYTINFKMTGETDTGLSFGATYRLDADGNSENNQSPAADNGTVWISGAFGKLTLGDTDGALDWAMTEVAMGTSITDEGTTHVGYSGNSHLDGSYDDQVLRYEYSFGDIGVGFSVEQDDSEDASGSTNDPVFGLGAKYATELSGVDLAFGLGYQSGETALGLDRDAYGLSVKAGFANGFTAIVNYSTIDADNDAGYDHYALGLGYEVGALLVHANWGKFDYDAGDSVDAYALIVNYDLGGGAILAAGYASDVDAATDGDQDQFSLGLSLSF